MFRFCAGFRPAENAGDERAVLQMPQNSQICRFTRHLFRSLLEISGVSTFFVLFAKTCYLPPVACGVLIRAERFERLEE